MAKLGAGDRLKGKLDQTSWVDSTDWVDGKQPDHLDAPIEFLEVEPAAYRLSPTRSQGAPSLAPSSSSPKIAALAAAVLVLVALVLISRPDDEDAFGQLPYDKQLEILERQGEASAVASPDSLLPNPAESETADSETPGAETSGADATDYASSDSGLPQPIPAPDPVAPVGGANSDEGADKEIDVSELSTVPMLSPDLPTDLPGVLATHGAAGSVVFIERSQPQPEEFLVGQPDNGTAGTSILVGDVRLTAPVVAAGQQFGWAQADGGNSWAARVVAADALLPSDDGIVMVRQLPFGQEVQLATFEEVTNDPRAGTLFMVDAETTVLGGHQGRLLTYADGQIWIVDETREAEPLTPGLPIGYDGIHLTIVQCQNGDGCWITVGPIEEPGRFTIAAGETWLSGTTIEAWEQVKATVSPDGTRLSMINADGVSAPNWIDLTTGARSLRAETVNADSPVAWSPDGRWLAYAVNDSLLVLNTDRAEVSTIEVGRPISSLAWLSNE